MPNLFPYTNTHELNLDWILQVVKDFQTKYTNFDQALADALAAITAGKVEALDEISTDLTAALNDIEASQTAAVTAIGNSKDQALSDIGAALTSATNAISALNTTVQGEITTLKNTSISEITTAQGTAISAITASMNHATTIIDQLYNTLPASAQDILGRLDLLDSIITGSTLESFTWQQGDYVYGEGVTPPTPPAVDTSNANYNYLVSNRYMTGVGGRRLRVITDGTIVMQYLLNWRNTPPGGAAGAYVPGQSDYFTSTYLDLLLPLNVTAISLTLSKPGMTDTISPTDITGHIEIQWITDFVSQRIIAPKESSSTADVAREEGEYFFLDGDLYVATDDIAVGDTIAEGTNCEKKTVGGELSDLKSAISDNNGNIIPSKVIVSDYEQITESDSVTDQVRNIDYINALVDGTTGAVGAANNTRITNNTLIDISKNSLITIGKSGVRLSVFLFDSSDALVKKIEITDTTTSSYVVENYGYHYKKLRILSFYSDSRTFTPTSAATILTIQVKAEISLTKNEIGKQKLDKTVYTAGYLSSGNGSISTNSSYKTSGFIPVYKDVPVTISPRCRFFLFYDKYQNASSGTYWNSDTVAPYTFTPSADGFIRISETTVFWDDVLVEFSPERTFFAEYGKLCPKSQYVLSESQEDTANKANYLYKKKYVACGDSFTQGDFTGYVDPDGNSGQNSKYIFDKQMNMYKTYPYWIAKRNSMYIVNEAISGSTMTYIPDRESSYPSFSNNRYKAIPADADYITLWFGINDAHQISQHTMELGSITDEVNTNFYGAWNVVMDYLIRNHPWAKIGIVITNGASAAIAQAERDIARKWGVPYLDLDGSDQVPLMLRTDKDYVNSDIKDFIYNTQKVPAENNGHPNLQAHMYESTFIEHWMRSL